MHYAFVRHLKCLVAISTSTYSAYYACIVEYAMRLLITTHLAI